MEKLLNNIHDKDLEFYENDLTREMDDYLTVARDSVFKTYIYKNAQKDENDNKFYAIRYPGATRGHIKTNKENIILEIKLYDDYNDSIYKKEVIDIFDKYIGMQLII